MSVPTSSLKKIHVLVNFNVGCCSLVEAFVPRLQGRKPEDSQIYLCLERKSPTESSSSLVVPLSLAVMSVRAGTWRVCCSLSDAARSVPSLTNNLFSRVDHLRLYLPLRKVFFKLSGWALSFWFVSLTSQVFSLIIINLVNLMLSQIWICCYCTFFE